MEASELVQVFIVVSIVVVLIVILIIVRGLRDALLENSRTMKESFNGFTKAITSVAERCHEINAKVEAHTSMDNVQHENLGKQMEVVLHKVDDIEKDTGEIKCLIKK